MKKITSVLLTLACSLPIHAWAESAEPEIPIDSRMKVLMYDDTDVYTIMTKFGYQTSVVFDKNEEIQTISVGDRSLWQLVPSGNRLFIRPMEEGAATNMTILTNKHSYQFDLKSLPTDKDTGVIYVAKFIYPDKHKTPLFTDDALPATTTPAPAPPPVMAPAAASAPQAKPAAAVPAEKPAEAVTLTSNEPEPMVPPNPDHQNDRYTYSGTDTLAPLQVFDDGSSTYIIFRDMTQPLPDPYVVDARGLEKPVSYTVQNNMMVIGRVVGEIELKSSAGNVSVYNELLDPKSR